jgi:hypothetical protein
MKDRLLLGFDAGDSKGDYSQENTVYCSEDEIEEHRRISQCLANCDKPGAKLNYLPHEIYQGLTGKQCIDVFLKYAEKNLIIEDLDIKFCGKTNEGVSQYFFMAQGFSCLMNGKEVDEFYKRFDEAQKIARQELIGYFGEVGCKVRLLANGKIVSVVGIDEVLFINVETGFYYHTDDIDWNYPWKFIKDKNVGDIITDYWEDGCAGMSPNAEKKNHRIFIPQYPQAVFAYSKPIPLETYEMKVDFSEKRMDYDWRKHMTENAHNHLYPQRNEQQIENVFKKAKI